MRQLGALVCGVLVGILTGCAVGPNYHAPAPTLSAEWHQPAEGGLVAGEADVQQWWQVFNDPTLTQLIDLAADGNLDARMAVLRIRQARALRGIATGAFLPTIGGNSSYQREKSSANTTIGGIYSNAAGGPGRRFANTVSRGEITAAVAQGLATAVPGAASIASPLANGLVGLLPQRSRLADTPEQDLFASGFDAAWELDVFGGIQRNVSAADADLGAAVEDYHGVLVSLFAEVATTYVDVRILQAEIEATTRNIDLQRETLALTQARLNYQLASDLEVQQAQTNLATTESQLPTLEAQLATSIYRLSVLVGREPAALYDELTRTAPIPQPPTETFVGVPADILRQRPDIRAAERRLAAETERIGVAAADLYPRFTLTGTLGFQSNDFDHALDSRSVTYGLGPAVRWNIFDGLRNLNRIAAQEVSAHYAYVAYEQTVLLALQDVESSMVYYKREQDRRAALTRATDSARRTVELARKRYEDGLTDFQDVVDAERSLVNLETALVQSEGQVVVNLVSLYKALGGGWQPGVTAQAQYLHAPSEALDHPLQYFWTGGRAPLPWNDTPSTNETSEGTTTHEP